MVTIHFPGCQSELPRTETCSNWGWSHTSNLILAKSFLSCLNSWSLAFGTAAKSHLAATGQENVGNACTRNWNRAEPFSYETLMPGFLCTMSWQD